MSTCLALLCLGAIPLDLIEHDRPGHAIAIRLFVLLPIQLAGLAALRRAHGRVAEGIAFGVPLAATVTTIVVIGLTTADLSPGTAERYYLAAAALVFAFSFATPLLFWQAIPCAFAALGAYAGPLVLGGELDAGQMPMLAFVIVITLFSLFARREHEAAEREAFVARRAQSALTEEQGALTAELQRLAEQLRLQAITDPLTGLANRRILDRSFQASWQKAADTGSWIAVALVDIDEFKKLNDAAGHQYGDDCLRAVALALKAVASEPGRLAVRFGGEEFVVLAHGADPDEILRLAEALRARVEALAIPHPGRDESGPVTVSVGVSSTRPVAGLTSDDLLRAADAALYAAKAAGRNRVSGREVAPQVGGRAPRDAPAPPAVPCEHAIPAAVAASSEA